jgi:hypothetical protein
MLLVSMKQDGDGNNTYFFPHSYLFGGILGFLTSFLGLAFDLIHYYQLSSYHYIYYYQLSSYHYIYYHVVVIYRLSVDIIHKANLS